MDEIFIFSLNSSLEVADKSPSSPSTESLKRCQESKSAKSKNHGKYIRKITCTLGKRAHQNPDKAQDRGAVATRSLLPLLPVAVWEGDLLPAAAQNSPREEISPPAPTQVYQQPTYELSLSPGINSNLLASYSRNYISRQL